VAGDLAANDHGRVTFPPMSHAEKPRFHGAILYGETQTRTGDTTIFSHPCSRAGYRVLVGVVAPVARVDSPTTSRSTWSDGNPRPANAAVAAIELRIGPAPSRSTRITHHQRARPRSGAEGRRNRAGGSSRWAA